MRHGQSEANVEHLWQGRGSSPLTAKGLSQASVAGDRLQKRDYSVVMSSNLVRAFETARTAGFEPEQDPIWLEGDLGQWEGLTFAQVMEQFGDELRQLDAGDEIPIGITGETAREVSDRALTGISEILERLDDEESALVVTHGGLINGLVRRVLDVPSGGRRLGIPANTSFCELTFVDESVRVDRFNDAYHLGPTTDWVAEHLRHGFGVVDLIRHGVTDANLEGRMQGHADWGLNEVGREQAATLANWLDPYDATYTASLGRATQTAEVLFDAPATPADELREIDMGSWNGMLWEDIPRDGVFNQVFVKHEDVPRGTTGETWAELNARVGGFINGLGERHPGERIAAVSHGGAIRSLIGGTLGMDYRRTRRQLGFLGNTAISQVILLPTGPMVTSYNVAGHLE